MTARHSQTQQAQLRALLMPIVKAGSAVCWRCKQPIGARQHWDAGHLRDLAKDPSQAQAPAADLIAQGAVKPEHRTCNRRAGARAGNKARGRRSRAAKSRFSETDPDSGLTSASPPSKRGRKASGRPEQVEQVFGDQWSRLIGPVAPARVPLPPSRNGLILPRLETPRRPRVKSLGPEAKEWIEGSGILGRWKLLPHQVYGLGRRLELDADGRLRWATCVATMARQQGKSVSLRSEAWWRLHQEPRFHEPQLLIQVANLSRLAREVWGKAARQSVAQYGKTSAKWGKGSEEIDLTSFGVEGRWLVQAADENAGVGYETTQADIDEAWNVVKGVVDDGIDPGMSEREQPQTRLWSTAGQNSSDLLLDYREQALRDTDGTGSVLLIEYSPPPELPWDHPNTWRWASPHWSERREARLRSKLEIGETAFAVQYLNRWVHSVNGWVPAGVWAQSYSDDPPPDRAPDVVAVEVSPEGERFGILAAWRDGQRVITRGTVTRSSTQTWALVDRYAPRRLLLPPSLIVHYVGRRNAKAVGATELARNMVGVGVAIRDGRVLHSRSDQLFDDDIGRAVAVTTDAGIRLSQAKSTGPIELARAMVWAVGEILKPGSPKPKAASA